MKISKIYLPILLAIAIVIGIFIGTRMNFASRPVAMLDQEVREQKLRQIISYIDYEYVDEVNTDSLLDLTITDLLQKLDPHSTYIAKQDVQRNEESLQGSFEGIGIEYIVYKDTLTVLRTLKGGPSVKAGLKAGDRIISVNGNSLVGTGDYEFDFTSVLKGPGGSKVKVGVYRPIDKKRRQITITRGKVPLNSVVVAYMMNDTIGFIKLDRFAETSGQEFIAAIKSLKKQGMRALVFDLRDNPGGLLNAAISISDQFLSNQKLIVYTKQRSGDEQFTYAEHKGIFEKGRVIVLINEGSASASEIVAGALQDNDRAVIVGRRSFGKGLVQEEMELKDGSRLRLTTARYYTPTGRSIQKPYVNGYDEYQKEAQNRLKNGELTEADSVSFTNQEKFITPGGRIVYGGGGIMPDIFVPIDTSGNTVGWLYHYFGYGQLDRFAFEYVDKNRAQLNKLSLPWYRANFEITDSIVKDILVFSGLENGPEEINQATLEILKTRTKALIARNLWGEAGMYPILFTIDPMVLKAKELFAKKSEIVLLD